MNLHFSRAEVIVHCFVTRQNNYCIFWGRAGSVHLSEINIASTFQVKATCMIFPLCLKHVNLTWHCNYENTGPRRNETVAVTAKICILVVIGGVTTYIRTRNSQRNLLGIYINTLSIYVVGADQTIKQSLVEPCFWNVQTVWGSWILY